MQKRSRLILLSTMALILLLIIVIAGRWQSDPGKALLLEHPGEVDAIHIRDSYDSVMLERSGSEWMLSGSEAINPVALENLLYAAGHMEVVSLQKELPPEAGEDRRSISFLRKGKPVLSYSLYPGSAAVYIRGKDGNYMGMSLPGSAGRDLSRVFSSHPGHYLEHVLIRYLPSEIRSIRIRRRGEEAFSFHMDDAGEISFNASPELVDTTTMYLDELAVRLLFSYFTGIRFEESTDSYDGPLYPRDSAHFQALLELESRSGERHRLEVHSLPVESGKDSHIFKACVYYNDRPDGLIINYIYLDVLMRGIGAYFGDKL